MNVTRRHFLKGVALTGVSGSLGGLSGTRAMASGGRPVSDEWMGVLVDLTKCNGCRECEAACRGVAGFPVPTKQELEDRSVFAELRRPDPTMYTVVNEFHPTTALGDTTPIYVKNNCLHCNDPACASACLVGALRKEADGAVTYDPWKCMGCRYCMVACPFQMPTYEYDNVFAPQVRKCTLCSDKGNPNKGGVPACVKACPKECLTYGKRSELLARAHDKIRQRPDVYVDHVYGEHEAGGTSWLYISGVPFEQVGFLKVDPEAPPRLSETIQHGVFIHFMPPLAWCGVLGLAMWLTRPEPRQDSEPSSSQEEENQTCARTSHKRNTRPGFEDQRSHESRYASSRRS